MPIERFNQLRLEYLRYSRDITVLKEKQEALHENSFSRRSQRRSASPMRSRNQRRSPSPDKWERKARSPSPEKWERKALSPQRDERRTRRYDDLNDDDYPRGCVCFVKRFHPEARGGVLKTLFQAILELEEVCPKDYLQHVDHRRNVDSVSFNALTHVQPEFCSFLTILTLPLQCHVRFKDAATASFFASYFSGNPKYSHVDPNSTDPNEAFAAVRKSDTIRPMEAEVIAGIPEAIYWSTVPKAIRKASSGVAKGTGALDADVDTTTAIDVTAVETDPVTARPGVDEGAESIASRKRSLDSPASGAVEVNDGGRSPKQARLATIDDN